MSAGTGKSDEGRPKGARGRGIDASNSIQSDHRVAGGQLSRARPGLTISRYIGRILKGSSEGAEASRVNGDIRGRGFCFLVGMCRNSHNAGLPGREEFRPGVDEADGKKRRNVRL